jgi:hypothetical protein
MRQGGDADSGVKPTTIFIGLIVLALLVGAIAMLALPDVRESVVDTGSGIAQRVQRMISPSLDIVHPVTAGATSQIEDHGPGKVIDTFSNTDWRSDEATPSITLTFQEPIDLGAVIVHNGSATGFVDQRRPATLRFTFPDGSAKDINLVDDHKPQEFTIDANGISEVVVSVLSTNGPAGTPMALSELEFFRLR